MKPQMSLTVLSMLFVALFLFPGCNREDNPPPNPGPAEQLGRELDKTIRGGVEQAEEAQKKLGERFEQMGKEMQKKAAEEENR
jgi:hypothetical protein